MVGRYLPSTHCLCLPAVCKGKGGTMSPLSHTHNHQTPLTKMSSQITEWGWGRCERERQSRVGQVGVRERGHRVRDRGKEVGERDRKSKVAGKREGWVVKCQSITHHVTRISRTPQINQRMSATIWNHQQSKQLESTKPTHPPKLCVVKNVGWQAGTTQNGPVWGRRTTN